MKFIYADPPYIGQAKKHYGSEEVDHRLLIDRLCLEGDAWALSCSSPSLPGDFANLPDQAEAASRRMDKAVLRLQKECEPRLCVGTCDFLEYAEADERARYGARLVCGVNQSTKRPIRCEAAAVLLLAIRVCEPYASG